MQAIPEWVMALDEEDLKFIKNFILASGSLKEIATLYGVTYPTVRLRLDRLIQKINITESAENADKCAGAKRRVDSAKPNPKGAQAST
jgi:hypothetical protein